MNLKKETDKVMYALSKYRTEKTAVFYDFGKLKMRYSKNGNFRDYVDLDVPGFIGIYTYGVLRAHLKSDLAMYFDDEYIHSPA